MFYKFKYIKDEHSKNKPEMECTFFKFHFEISGKFFKEEHL